MIGFSCAPKYGGALLAELAANLPERLLGSLLELASMTNISSAHSAHPFSSVPSISDDDMAKHDVPILEIRPHDGGLRRFAVISIEPAASVEARFYSYTGDYLTNDMRLDFWTRVEGRGIVARLRLMPVSGVERDKPKYFLGVGPNAEAAVTKAWASVEMKGEKIPIELRRAARDLDVELNPPEVE